MLNQKPVDPESVQKFDSSLSRVSLSPTSPAEPRRLSEEEQKLLGEAKDVEIQSFLNAEVCRASEKAGIPARNIMRMRWVRTWKHQPRGTKKGKARLVVLGCTAPGFLEVDTGSPTPSRRARNLFHVKAA